MTESQNTPPESPKAPSEGPEANQQPQPGVAPEPQLNMLTMQALKRAQNLVLVANIAGPVSIFIGGVLLSTIGVVCAVIANLRLRALMADATRIGAAATQLRRASFIAIGICAVALVLNGIAFFIMLPEVMQMMESGYGDRAADTGTNSVWG